MASIQDVADQINAKLDSITNATQATAVNTSETLDAVKEIRDMTVQANDRLADISGQLQSGFTNLSQGLFAIVELQRTTNHLLDHHRRQHDTIICELVNANELLCGITRKFTQQLELSESAVVSLRRLEGISERVHAEAAGDYDRDLELTRKIEACCPPPRPEVERCPERCEQPRFDPRRPDGQQWEPLPTPRPIG